MDTSKLLGRFAEFLLSRYGLKPDDVAPTDVPGYWEIKKECGGLGHCNSPIHSFMFCEAPTRHTIQYYDPRRAKNGKLSSPYETWRAARMITVNGETEGITGRS